MTPDTVEDQQIADDLTNRLFDTLNEWVIRHDLRLPAIKRLTGIIIKNMAERHGLVFREEP